METIIQPDQTYGMSSRSIEENIRVQADMIQWCDHLIDQDFAPEGGAAGWIGMMDVDFRKGFDAVNINFLVEACLGFGLGEMFCRWISLFYRDSSDDTGPFLRTILCRVRYQARLSH